MSSVGGSFVIRISAKIYEVAWLEDSRKGAAAEPPQSAKAKRGLSRPPGCIYLHSPEPGPILCIERYHQPTIDDSGDGDLDKPTESKKPVKAVKVSKKGQALEADPRTSVTPAKAQPAPPGSEDHDEQSHLDNEESSQDPNQFGEEEVEEDEDVNGKQLKSETAQWALEDDADHVHRNHGRHIDIDPEHDTSNYDVTSYGYGWYSRSSSVSSGFDIHVPTSASESECEDEFEDDRLESRRQAQPQMKSKPSPTELRYLSPSRGTGHISQFPTTRKEKAMREQPTWATETASGSEFPGGHSRCSAARAIKAAVALSPMLSGWPDAPALLFTRRGVLNLGDQDPLIQNLIHNSFSKIIGDALFRNAFPDIGDRLQYSRDGLYATSQKLIYEAISERLLNDEAYSKAYILPLLILSYALTIFRPMGAGLILGAPSKLRLSPPPSTPLI
ncbi:hypothetical protein B0H13DRAFT_1851241 [Mycena leptocephala]|nr:hypothetical protein B0H13DRAFT_1851241 [Mycena leptocephala]